MPPDLAVADVLDAVASGELAYRTPAAVAAELGRDPDRVADALAELEEAGLVVTWEPPPVAVVEGDDRPRLVEYPAAGPFVTLTPAGALAAGVVLVEDGGWLNESPRWARQGEPEPPPPRTPPLLRALRIPTPCWINKAGNPCDCRGCRLRRKAALARRRRGNRGESPPRP